MTRILGCAWLGVLLLSGLAFQASAGAKKLSIAQAENLFAAKVLPLLRDRCFGCHGNDRTDLRADLSLLTRKDMLKGGDNGPAVVPAHPEKSLLLTALEWRGPKMPPREKDRLTPEQIGWVRDWIAAGAPWPDKLPAADVWQGPANGVLVKTSGGLTEAWNQRRYAPEDLWAYQPIRKPRVPWEVVGAAPGLNPIDVFLAEKMAAAKLKPAGRADAGTLVRRLFFGVTGLPPAPGDIQEFGAAFAPGPAWEKLVERLLASPHYGEHMARMWFDVVRYADSGGFSNDFERPHAWRYRDYVVRAFNNDKPFDRFLLEQLAGDELDPNDPEMLIAVGYLRMGPWEHTGMSVAAVTRQQWLDDVTNSVGETFLAAPLSCCRCHDHKFDPLPTRDYYRFQAVFAPAQFADREAAFLPAENIRAHAEQLARLEKLLKDTDAVRPVLPANAGDKLIEETRLGIKKLLNKRDDFLRREMQRYKPLAMSVYNGPVLVRNGNLVVQPMPARRDGAIQPVHILIGGALEAPGDKVEPGTLSVLPEMSVIPNTADGRRLALARWLASPKNPLTARVIVNRVWQHYFGVGLVATANNFGKMGKRPTHPELLDWLADWFTANGWSIKKLSRLILTSAAYQRAAAPVDPQAAEKLDPANQLLSYFPPRRLTAEELRDAMLQITGELNLEVGGPPVKPEIHSEVAFQPRHVMGTVAPAYQPSRTPGERNRRTIYALRLRTLGNPLLEVFDQPGADLSCERRNQSTVTPQVFSLFNGAFSHARALALARRLEKEAAATDKRIERAFLLVFGRPPSAKEKAAAARHVAKMTAHHQTHPLKATPLPRSIMREFVEEQTGTKFRWEERLDFFENYVPDLQPWEVGPATRALADLCLALFNANEFVYLH